MEILTVNLKNYRISYRLAIAVTGLIIAVCRAMVQGWHFVLFRFYRSPQLLFIMIVAFVLVPFYFSNQQRTKLKSLDGMANFDEKKQLHESMYKARVLWLALMAVGGCVLYLAGGRIYFLYLSLFEYFLLLVSFPNERLASKELKNDDIIFI